MSRAWLLFFSLFVSVSVIAEGHLIQGVNLEPFTTKEILVPHDDDTEVVNNVVDAPLDNVKINVAGLYDNIPSVASDKKCAAVGEFCMNHSDCCSKSCLGYMKKCVS